MALSPTSSRGSTFNGGTITNPLIIAPTALNTPALEIQSATGGIGESILVHDEGSGGVEVFAVNAGGGVYLSTSDRGAANRVLLVDGSTASPQTGPVLEVRDKDNHITVRTSPTGGLGVFQHAAAAQPSATGALSTVIDPAAKAVLTSLLAALVSIGLATDGTT